MDKGADGTINEVKVGFVYWGLSYQFTERGNAIARHSLSFSTPALLEVAVC